MKEIFVLLGFMGSGKTNLIESLRLSESHGYEVTDLDDLIVKGEGSTVPEIFQKFGEEYFRSLETQYLEEFLNSREQGILALGGGAFHSHNRIMIEKVPGAQSIWINTPFEVCWERIKDDENRPLVKQGKDVVEKLYLARISDYNQANHHLDQNAVGSIQNVDELLRKIRR